MVFWNTCAVMAFRVSQVGTFLREVRQELKGVQWPSRTTTIRFTILIVAMSAVVAGVAGAFDVALTALVERFLLR